MDDNYQAQAELEHEEFEKKMELVQLIEVAGFTKEAREAAAIFGITTAYQKERSHVTER